MDLQKIFGKIDCVKDDGVVLIPLSCPTNLASQPSVGGLFIS
jgi:hypothetical protein